jgi:hypothetical protein
VVAVYNASNGYMVESGSGRPFDGVAQVNITQTGTYFAVMRGGNNTSGLTAQYLLDVNIVPTGSVDFPNLQVTASRLPAGGPFLSGQPVTFDYTVTNVGSQPTNTGNWSDKVVLSLNTIFGDADDVTLGVFPHSGILDPGGSTPQPRPSTLPHGISGDFYLLVETDTSNAVSEFLLEGDNVTASDGTFRVNLAEYPDLRVEDLTIGDPRRRGCLHGQLDDGQPGQGDGSGRVQGADCGPARGQRCDRRRSRDHRGRPARGGRHGIARARLLVHAARHASRGRHHRFAEPDLRVHGGRACGGRAEQHGPGRVEVTLDLQVTAASSTSSTAAVGEVISVSYTVQNQGTATAAADWSTASTCPAIRRWTPRTCCWAVKRSPARRRWRRAAATKSRAT